MASKGAWSFPYKRLSKRVTAIPRRPAPTPAGSGHRLVCLKRLDRQKDDEFVELAGPWKTYGSGQKSHFHPQLTPDRKWILFTGGVTGTSLGMMSRTAAQLLDPAG